MIDRTSISKPIAILIAVLMILVTISGALAQNADVTAVTITSPAASSANRGTLTVTGSYTGNSSGNITVLVNTTVVCADTTVGTANSTFTCNFNSASFTDAVNYYLNATAYNVSVGGVDIGSTAFDTNLLITLDNSIPRPNMTTSTISVGSGKEIIIDCSGSSDLIDSSLTYAQTWTDPIGTNTSGGTSSTATYRSTTTQVPGIATATCRLDDDAGNVAFVQATISVSGGSDGQVTYIVEAIKTTQSKAAARSRVATAYMGGGLFLLFAVVGWVLFFKKK